MAYVFSPDSFSLSLLPLSPFTPVASLTHASSVPLLVSIGQACNKDSPRNCSPRFSHAAYRLKMASISSASSSSAFSSKKVKRGSTSLSSVSVKYGQYTKYRLPSGLLWFCILSISTYRYSGCSIRFLSSSRYCSKDHNAVSRLLIKQFIKLRLIFFLENSVGRFTLPVIS